MTIYEILENTNIKPDRFGMAAISYIYKAFGDNVRSKEFWPWGNKVNCPWTKTAGFKNDLQLASKCINKAIDIYSDLYNVETTEQTNLSEDAQILDIYKDLNKINNSIDDLREIDNKIKETNIEGNIEYNRIANNEI